MAAAIGSLTGFSVWRGVYQAPLAPVRIVTRTGVGSTGLLVGTARGVPVEVDTWLWSTLALCQAHETACLALHGTVQSCTDQLGSTYANTVVILHPAPPGGRIIRAGGLGDSGGGSPVPYTHLIHCTWTHIPEP